MFSWNISRALQWTVIVHSVAGISVWVHVWEITCQLILVKYLLVQLKNRLTFATLHSDVYFLLTNMPFWHLNML